MSKQPKMVPDEKGNLVTTGQWYSASELERQQKAIANHYYKVGVKSLDEQYRALQDILSPITTAINGTIAISQCDNGVHTRAFARKTLPSMKEYLKAYNALSGKQNQYPDIEINVQVYQEYGDWFTTIIELLEKYTAPEMEGDTRTDEHAELRRFLESIHPELETFSIERLGYRERGGDIITQAAAQRVDELMVAPRMTVPKARRQVASEMNLSFQAVKKAHQRYGKKRDS